MNVQVAIDLIDIAHLMAGGTVSLNQVGIDLIPATDIHRISTKVRTRVHGGRRVHGATKSEKADERHD